jgi:ActR/RegA family two-component response regulator
MNKPGQKCALLVHSDMEILSKLQNALLREGFITIVARDISSALLAVTQHQFQLAAVFSDLGEPGAGWPLAGVLRMAFPRAFVCVLDQSEPQLSGVRSAINYGVQQIYRQTTPVAELVSSLLADSQRSP